MLGLVTAGVAAALDPDLLPLRDALADRIGEDRVAIVDWDDAAVDWSRFDAIVIRSTWDYADRIDEFLAWVDRVEVATTLVNPADSVRWSTDKRYLAALADEGVPIVPTEFVPPGEAAPLIDPDAGIHVVKPAVGAGSNGARRCEPDEVAAHVRVLHDLGRTAMIQPYLDLLDEHGETALCFVAAAGEPGLEVSHAFRKGAILTTVEVEQEGGLFAKEEIARREPTDAEVALGRAALATDVVRSHEPLTFARVDVAPFRDTAGRESFVVMELELIEPSFYFVTCEVDGDDPADRFAERLLDSLSRSGVLDAVRHSAEHPRQHPRQQGASAS